MQESFLKGEMILFKGVTSFAFEMMSHGIREAVSLQACNIFSKVDCPPTLWFREVDPAALDLLQAESLHNLSPCLWT